MSPGSRPVNAAPYSSSCVGDGPGDGPAEDGETQPFGGGQGRGGGPGVVGMAGDAVAVEDEKPVGPDLVGEIGDVGGQVAHVDLGQCAVGVVHQPHRLDAQRPRSTG